MCGICGFISEKELDFDREKVLDEMLELMRHRGPDSGGVFLDNRAALGMRRLSIIDLETGDQPIFSEDGSVVLVCNGEIYNFQHLKKDLMERGHKFNTATDVEVIVHLYEDFGEEMVSHLEGMFALALWDRKEHRLIVARDGPGIKPLFYYERDGLFLFSSELTPMVTVTGINTDCDYTALYDYFSYNYIPSPRTIYKHIRKLEAGCYLVLDRGKVSRKVRWHDINPADTVTDMSEDDWAEEVYHTLREAVRSHLVSDVPLGVFLSGGIDSSAIVALMRSMDVPIRTFSIGFEEKSFNELEYARRVAKAFECEHHEEIVRPDAVSLVRKMAGFFGEPFADSSALPVYLVSQLAARHVKVVLSGEGGDELFAGYMTYEADMLAEYYKVLPGIIRNKIIPAMVDMLPVSTKKVSLDYKARRFVQGADNSLINRHYAWKVIFDEERKQQLLKNELYPDGFPPPSERIYEEWFSRHDCERDPLNNVLYADTGVYLPDDLLVKVDRMSMAHSLETRVPFLDRKLMDLAFTIPSSLKLKGRKKKYILKKALKDKLPEEIINRKKAGFSIPAARWFKEDLREFARDILSPDNIRKTGVLNPEFVQKVWRDHQEGKAENSRQIWSLMMYMLFAVK